MNTMHNPPHPGEVLREWLEGVTVTDAAERLGVTRAALSRVLNGGAGISPEMDLRLSKALGTTRKLVRDAGQLRHVAGAQDLPREGAPDCRAGARLTEHPHLARRGENAVHPAALVRVLFRGEGCAMTVTRKPDPLGLLPDHIRIDPAFGAELEDIAAFIELVNRNTLGSRINRLRRHAQFNTYADELHALTLQKGLGTKDIEGDWELRARVAEAEVAALYFDAEYLPARTRGQTGKQGGDTKKANDSNGKQAAKAGAFRMWKDWQTGKAVYASGAAFARHVVEQTVIEDPNTVQRWIRKWRADHRPNR